MAVRLFGLMESLRAQGKKDAGGRTFRWSSKAAWKNAEIKPRLEDL
jgi:hypothetical protein